MTQPPETQKDINADHAWAHLTSTFAFLVPRHLHNAQHAWRRMATLRRKG